MHLFIDDVVLVAAYLVEQGETVPVACSKSLALLSSVSKMSEDDIAYEVVNGLFLKQKYDKLVKDWSACRRLSDDKKLALLVKRAVKHRQRE